MTDPAAPTTDTAEPADESNDTPVPHGAPADQDDTGKEAAKYRRRLRETETERDSLSTRLEVLQRAEAERLAASALADGADLWRDGAQLADLLDDDGNLDPAKITTHASELVAAHPHWRKLAPAAPPASSVTANGKIGDEQTPSWTDVLQGRVKTE